MENLIATLDPAAMTLIAIVAAMVQQLKRSSWIQKLSDAAPVYQLASLVFSIGGAYFMGLMNPIVAGVIVALAASGAYDATASATK